MFISYPASPSKRASLHANDNRLSKAARLWVRSLPARLRPLALCSGYARLANRLALVWDDPERTEALFDELLIDHRGGRHGFAPLVATELMRLHHVHERRLAPIPTDLIVSRVALNDQIRR